MPASRNDGLGCAIAVATRPLDYLCLCLNEGKSAHYEIIVDMLVCRNVGQERDKSVKLGGMREITDEADACDSLSAGAHVLLLVQHGLARQLVIGTWSEFFASNQQLRTVDWTKHDSATEMNLSDHLIFIERIIAMLAHLLDHRQNPHGVATRRRVTPSR